MTIELRSAARPLAEALSLAHDSTAENKLIVARREVQGPGCRVDR